MEYTDFRSLCKAIFHLLYTGGTTNMTAAALEFLLNSTQDGTMRFRPGVPRIAILITGGVSNDSQRETVPFAERFREADSFHFFDQLLEALARTPCDSELSFIYSICCFKFTIHIQHHI